MGVRAASQVCHAQAQVSGDVARDASERTVHDQLVGPYIQRATLITLTS